ncbi:hypothetical protein AAV94_02535 [Lampropedia cohaerens]|uniref:Mce/MlaD domain-containing protein n=1 Tax=Lampropedia cohaerens TaxID=1610491 RepID=A0A0U1Q2P6_9BURK|nr:hypothetical protein AAV94_02535 [Lampropedia cohaerens]
MGIGDLPPSRLLHVKAMALMLLTVVLTIGAVLYVFYARGAFEDKQELVLIAEDSEGIAIGMDLTFSGFPIGSVRRIELADDGSVRIHVDLLARQAHRLRESSIFTMVRNILGATSLKAYTSEWDDPPLPDGAERVVLFGDASAEIPQLMASARSLLNNLTDLTSGSSDLAQSLQQLNALGSRLGEAATDGGALRLLLGEGPELAAVQSALRRTDTLLRTLNTLARNADHQVFSQSGLMGDAQASLRALTQLLHDTRQSLQQVDAILRDAKTISGNVSESTQDLAQLRTTVERNLRQLDTIMDQLQNTWPFTQDHRLTLP